MEDSRVEEPWGGTPSMRGEEGVSSERERPCMTGEVGGRRGLEMLEEEGRGAG